MKDAVSDHLPFSGKQLMLQVVELVPKHPRRTKKREPVNASTTLGPSRYGKGGKKKTLARATTTQTLALPSNPSLAAIDASKIFSLLRLDVPDAGGHVAAVFSRCLNTSEAVMMMLMIQVLCCRWLFACHKYNSGIELLVLMSQIVRNLNFS
ncbi:putative alpha-L-arabinofuranosidase 1-like [Iris pallida]|uniref:Alpha-L-arabinofuranosidase 1-like n=1 Tax=Iris pallida TaxID=29817 RepID=A0AAX6ESN7_IRIPA|nr:putative alpha-L-arabinofuranosidase 1-like [Iris pallida]KAJ6828435.1 putative alpha-L-arabinofuranosidase 1-like [Iris pallida]